ncbi:MAG: choice-of-anchor D domain-containing protein [Acidobacteria bacterium]|nr:choice-of-anchor D domain-containing protein [Acidobacteriota bacterium]
MRLSFAKCSPSPLRAWVTAILLLLVPAGAAGQTTSATATRWDIFGATGGNFIDPGCDPQVDPNSAACQNQEQVRAQGTQNIQALARDGAGVAGPAGAVWFAADRPNVRVGRLSPDANTYTEWRVLNLIPNNESGFVGGLALNPTTDFGNPFRGDLWLTVKGTPTFVLKTGDAPDNFRKWVIGDWILEPEGIAASGVSGLAYAAVTSTNIPDPTGAGVLGLIVRLPRDLGQPLYSWSSLDIRPRHVAVTATPAGDIIWFTNAKNNTLAMLDLTVLDLSLPITEWPLSVQNPAGLHVNGSEVCVVGQGVSGTFTGEVECIDTAANTSTRFSPAPGLDLPQQLARTQSGELFVTEQGSNAQAALKGIGNAVIFVGQQAVRGTPVAVTPVSRMLAFFELNVVNSYDETISAPLELSDAPFTSESLATVTLTGTNIGNGHVRFPMPLLPQTDLEPLDRYPQPEAISEAFNDAGAGTGSVFLAESFDGPIGTFRGARIERIELVEAQGLFDICAPQDSCGVTTLNLSATVDDLPITQSFFVENAGMGALDWEVSASSSDFTISVSPMTGDVSGTEQDEVMVTVAVPADGGTYSGTITVSSPSGAADPVTLDVVLTVANTTPDIEVSSTYPLPLAFSTNRNVTVDPKSFTVRNRRGGSPLSWTTEIQYHEGTGWLSVNPTGDTNESDESTAVSVAIVNYASLAPGGYTATILVKTSDDPDDPSTPVDVALTITAPTIALGIPIPYQVTFPPSQQGANLSQAVTLTNTGTGPLNPTIATSEGASWLGASIGGALPIGPNGTDARTLTITANLGSLAPGPYNGTVTLTDLAATNSPQVIDVSVTVEAAAVVTLRFGGVDLPPTTPFAVEFVKGSETPFTRQLEIANTGEGGFDYTAAITLQSGSGWLSIDGADTGTVETTSSTLTLRFDTGALSPGVYDATLAITAEDAGNSPLSLPIRLTVKGGRFEITPAAIEYTVGRGKPAVAQTVTVKNIGAAPLNFTMNLTEPGGDWFNVTASDTSLGPNDTATLTITFNNATTGDFTGGRIDLSDPNAENSGSVQLTLHVTPSPQISTRVVDPVTGAPSALMWVWNPQFGAEGRLLIVRNDGDATLNATVTPMAGWLLVGPNPGSVSIQVPAGTEFGVPVNVNGLQLPAPGVALAGVVVAADNALPSQETVLAQLTVPFPPVITLAPTALTFTVKRGQDATAQQVTLSNAAPAGGQPLNFLVETFTTDGGGWLLAAPQSPAAIPAGGSTILTVAPNSTSLSAGTYTGIVRVSSLDGSAAPKEVAVTLVVQPGAFTLAPSQLMFQATEWTQCNLVQSGSNPPSQTLVVTNTTDRPFWFTAQTATSTGGPWLSVRPEAHVVPPRRSRTIRVSIDARDVLEGAHGGAITVSALTLPPHNPHSVVTESETIPVLLQVVPSAPTLCVSPLTLDFGILPPNATSMPLEVAIQNAGDGDLGAWTATALPLKKDRGTIDLSAVSGFGSGTILVSITTGKKEGTQDGTIIVSAPEAAETPQVVKVRWKVKKPKPPHDDDDDDCHGDHDRDGDHDDDDHFLHRPWDRD